MNKNKPKYRIGDQIIWGPKDHELVGVVENISWASAHNEWWYKPLRPEIVLDPAMSNAYYQGCKESEIIGKLIDA